MGNIETFIAIAIAATIVSLRNEKMKEKAKKQQQLDEMLKNKEPIKLDKEKIEKEVETKKKK